MSNPNTITVPVEFQSVKPEAEVIPVVHFGQKESYPVRTGDVQLDLTPEQTAAKLAEKEASERMVQAAGESVAAALAAAETAKYEQL